MTVQPSVAQAAMIGNPVSMPRVIELVRAYNRIADEKRIFIIQVTEQEIMDAMIIANRNGNIACTQGGESMAGFKKAIQKGYVGSDETGVLDSTAHMLKFLPFQEMYFNDNFGPEFKVSPRSELKNAPILVKPEGVEKLPEPGQSLKEEDLKDFVREMALEIAKLLHLENKS